MLLSALRHSATCSFAVSHWLFSVKHIRYIRQLATGLLRYCWRTAVQKLIGL